MASQIDPDPTSKPTRRPAELQAKPPAAPQPAAKVPPPKPVAKGAAPKPVAKPAARPTAVPSTQPAAAQADAGHEDEPEVRPASRGVLMQVPAWAISMLVHIVALLAMALIAGESTQLDQPTVITSSTSEEVEEFNEFDEQQDTPEETPEQAQDPVADVMVTTEVAVEPVEVAAIADDLEAAPMSVELTDFGSETAPASDMMSTIGAIGGTGGGLGGRANASKIAAANGGGGDTEQAVDRALKWIAQHQMPDGGWSFDLAKCPSCMGKCSHSGDSQDRCGATAMALLPFLGRGYTHREGPFKKPVEAGIGFLAQMAIAGNGKAYGPGGSLYSQGLAGIALSECFAMSQDNRLAAPTQSVLNFIMAAQDPVGGGWRYSPRQAGDTSAVGWQIMALKSGNMAYLQVNPLTVKKAVEFLDSVKGDEYGSGYGYTGPGDRPGTSAVGLLCRMYLGWKKDHPGIQEGAKKLAKIGPNKDLYYSYYGTQIMHHMEGEMWIAWNNKMKALLLASQSNKDHEAGSW